MSLSFPISPRARVVARNQLFAISAALCVALGAASAASAEEVQSAPRKYPPDASVKAGVWCVHRTVSPNGSYYFKSEYLTDFYQYRPTFFQVVDDRTYVTVRACGIVQD